MNSPATVASPTVAAEAVLGAPAAPAAAAAAVIEAVAAEIAV